MTQTPEGWNTTWQPGEPDFLTPPPPPPPAPPTPWYRQRRLQVLAGIVTALVALAIVLPLTLAGGPPEVPMTIGIALIDSEDGGNCSAGGDGGYSDIEPGMPVTVEDENHKILASTSLPSHGYEGDSSVDMGCVWQMKVTVPSDRQQYGVTAGRRGTVTFDRAELIRDKWEATMSLGGDD